MVNGETAVALSVTAVFASANASYNAIGVTATSGSLTGAAAANYVVNQETAATTAKINQKAITVKADAKTKVYGDSDPTLTYVVDGLVGNDELAGALARDDGENVASYVINQGDLNNPNYSIDYAPDNLAITPKALTWFATASDKVYDGNTTATATSTLSGMVNGETAVALSVTAVFASANASSTAIDVTATKGSLTGDAAANYVVTQETATTTADITPKTITGSITAADKDYDGNTSATITSRTLSGVLDGDTVTYVGGSATFDSKTVGTWAVTATGLSLGGAQAGNYTVNDTASTTAAIKATLVTPEDTQVAITLGDLSIQIGETGYAITSVLVKEILSGSLKIGADAASASDWNSETNAVVDAAHQAFWTPPANATGMLAAFTMVGQGDAAGQVSSPITANALVTSVNDAPNLVSTVLNFQATEDAGIPVGAVGALVSTLTGGISDVDAGDITGIAIIATNVAYGTWFFSTNDGNTWAPVGSVDGTQSLLLASDTNTRIYFQSTVENYSGTCSGALTFRAWDGTSGTAGSKADTTTTGGATAFSATTELVSAVVNPVNDLTVVGAGANLAYTENASGAPITPNLTLTDVDDPSASAGRVAITANYTDGDTLSIAADSLLDGVTASYSAGVLTFTGTTTLANYQSMFRAVTFSSTSHHPTVIATTREVTYSVTDANASNATNGAQTGSGISVVTITEVNDKPLLTTISTLSATVEDTAYEITYAMLADAADESDAETAAPAFRVERVSTGTLQKWNGSAWASITSGSTLLGFGEKFLWTPAANANGTISAFEVVAFDGEKTSTTSVQVRVAVTALNDAPVATVATVTLAAVSEGASSFGVNFPVETFTSSTEGWAGNAIITDGSTPWTISNFGTWGSVLGYFGAGAEITKTYTLDGSATTATFDFLRADSWDAEYFRVYANGVLIINQALSGYYTPAVTETFSGSANGYSWTMVPKEYGNFVRLPEGESGSVAAWNDQRFAVTINIPAGVTTLALKMNSTLDAWKGDESWGIDNFTMGGSSGSTVSTLFGPGFSDSADSVTGGSSANTLAGIAITSYTADPAMGRWQYKVSGTSTWVNIPDISSSAEAFVLKAADVFGFLPAGDYNGAATPLTAVLIDSSTTVTSGSTLDVSVRGATTAFSAGLITVNTTVNPTNDASVLAGTPANPTVVETDGTNTSAGTSAGLLLSAASVADLDFVNASFGGGYILASLGQYLTGDVLDIAPGVAQAANAVQLSGTSVQISNGTAWTTIGTIDATSTGLGKALKINLNSATTEDNIGYVLTGIRFRSTSDNPTANGTVTSRNYTVQVNDGANNGLAGGAALDSNALAGVITISNPLNDLPVNDLNGDTAGINSTVTWTETPNALSTAVAVMPNANLADADNTNLTSIYLTFSGVVDGNNEVLKLGGASFLLATDYAPAKVGDYTIAYTASTGLFAVTPASGATFSLAGAQTLLRGMTYNNTTHNPTANPDRTITVTVSDAGDNNAAGGTISTSVVATGTLVIHPVNDTPVVTPVTLSYTDTVGDDTFANKTGTIIATDAETATADLRFALTGGTSVSYTSGGVTYNQLKSSAFGNFYLESATGNYLFEPNNAAIQALFVTTSATFDVTATDSLKTGTAQATLAMTATDDTNLIALGTLNNFIEQTPVVIAPNATVSAPRDGMLQLRVSIDNNKVDDTLSATVGNTGISQSYNAATGVLTLNKASGGTAEEFQQVLRTVTFYNPSDAPDNTLRTVTVSTGYVVPYFSHPDHMVHYYEYVNAGSINWGDAKTAAELKFYNGLQGYLATVTSDLENEFIHQKVASDAWIGGSDDFKFINAIPSRPGYTQTTYADQNASEGKWTWVTGPEAGTIFSIWGSTTAGNYSHWNAGEPNNSGGENVLEFYTNGSWNDLRYTPGSSHQLAGYVVEYGGYAGDPGVGGDGNGATVVASGTFTVTLANDTPALSGAGSVTYTENGVPLAIAPNAIVSDPDLPANFNSGFLIAEITNNGSSPDQLSIINTVGGITTTGGLTTGGTTVSYNGTSIGVIDITLNGANNTGLKIALNSGASVSATQALMRAIGFNSTSDDPSTLARTVKFSLNDGMNISTLAGDTALQTTMTATVNFLSVNDSPVILATVSGTWTEGNAASLQFLSGATVGDPDATHFNTGSLTVAFGAFVPGDVLSVIGGANGITLIGTTVSYNGDTIGTVSGGSAANLVISFTSAKATYAAVQALIAQVGYASTSANPTAAGASRTRAVTVTLNDGGNNSTAGTATPKTATQTGTIAVVGVNNPSTLTGLEATSVNTFVQGGSGSVIAPNATLSDADLEALTGVGQPITSGLLAYYNFDTDATDSSGNNNNGTNSATSTGAAGRFGNAFSFNGTSSYVSVPVGVTSGKSQFSVGMWVKSTESRSNSPDWQNPTLFGMITNGAQSSDLEIIAKAGRVGFYHGIGAGDSSYTSGPLINDNAWHQITLTANGTTLSLYVDGILASTSPATLALANYSFSIGAANGLQSGLSQNYSPFAGTIDDFAFWNRSLTSSEVTQLANATSSSILGKWNGSTLSVARTNGASANDLFSGSGNLGALTAASGNVVLSSTTIGTYTQAGGQLVITFNDSATTARVQETLRSLTYSNTIAASGQLGYDAVNISFTFNDQNSNNTGGGVAGSGQDQGNGGLSTAGGTITINLNRTPVAVADTNSIDEGIATIAVSIVSGNVLLNDSDQDAAAPWNDTLSVAGVAAGSVSGPVLTSTNTSVRGYYGTVKIAADGSYTYTLDNTLDAVQRLAVNESITDTFSYTVSDSRVGAPGRTTTTLTVTIHGTNDAPKIITGSGDQVQLTTGNNKPTIRIAIPATGVVAGDSVRLTYLGQSQAAQVVTAADIALGYVDVPLTMALQDAAGSLAAVPVKWMDWTSSTATTVNGTFTTESQTVTATLTSAVGFAFVQANGGTNYFNPTKPYESTGVAAPTNSDIIAFNPAGWRTLNFSAEVRNLYFAFVSMNGNGYRFDRDFDILSQANVTGGYFGAGEARKREITINGKTYYELYCVFGEPHGVVQFKGAFSSLTWENPFNEYWHGFTVGIKSTSNDLQNVKGDFLNNSGTVVGTGPTMLVAYDPNLPYLTGALDTTISAVRLTETNAALTATGNLTLLDVDTTNVVTAAVDSVTITGVQTGLTLTNAQVKAMLTATSTDTSALQVSKINWAFNSAGESFDWLAADEELNFTYTLSVSDGFGGTASSTVTVTIVGTNDTAVLTNGVMTGAVTEGSGALTVTGSVAFLDADRSNTATVRVLNDSLVWSGGTLTTAQQNALYAAFSITPASFSSNSGTVVWTYAPTESILDFMAANETLTMRCYIEVTDSSGKAVSALVTLTTTGANDAPRLADTVLSFASSEDSATPTASSDGTLISTLMAGVSDIDTTNTSRGVAITALNTTQGNWYRLLAGGSWTLISTAPSDTAALLLPSDARLYFKPTTNWNGAIDPAITLRAWDRTTGTAGGTANTTVTGDGTAFSVVSDTVSLVVAAANDAPTALQSSVLLSATNEDSTTSATIASLFGDIYSDATDQVINGSSAQAMAGIVVMGNAATPAQGVWEYSANGSTGWTAIGTGVSTTAGVYLPNAYSLRFNPTANWNGSPGLLTTRLVDSSGTAPNAGATTVNVSTSGGISIYSNQGNAVTLGTTIRSINDAPTLTTISTLAGKFEDIAMEITYEALAAASNETDVENSAPAFRIEALSTGTLQKWVNSAWTAVTAGSTLVSSGEKLLWTSAINFNGIANAFTVVAYDGELDSGSPIQVRVIVGAVNDAPFASGTATLPRIQEDAANPAGATVATLFTTNFDDQADTVANGTSANTLAGIAVISYTVDGTKGQWQFSATGTGGWTNILSVTSASAALTFKATDYLRFLAASENSAAPKLETILIETPTGVSTGGTLDVSSRGGSTSLSSGTVMLGHSLDQTITFVAPALKTYGDSFVLIATATSDLPVIFSIIEGPATLTVDANNLTHITYIGVGTVTIGASQGGNYQYNPAASVSQTFAIARKTLTGSITVADRVYNATTGATIATYKLEGVVGTDVVSYTGGSANFVDKNVGASKVVVATGLTLSGAAAAYYTVNDQATTNATVTQFKVYGNFQVYGKEYDSTTTVALKSAGKGYVVAPDANGNAPSTTYCVSAVFTGDVAVFTVKKAEFTSKNVGNRSAKIVGGEGVGYTFEGADVGNYLLIPSLSRITKISPRQLSSIIVVADRDYDATKDANVVYSELYGLLGDDNVNIAWVEAQFTDKNVGAKTLNQDSVWTLLDGLDAGNYEVPTARVKMINTPWITPLAITGSFTVNDRGYDATTVAAIATTSANQLADPQGKLDDVWLTVESAKFENANANANTGAGPWTVRSTGSVAITGNDAKNYILAAVSDTTATINKIHQTLTWGNHAAITYGETISNTQLDATVAGVAGGTAPGALTYSEALGAVLGAGTRHLTVTAAPMPNYLQTSTTVDLVVNKAAQTIAWNTPANITYGSVLGNGQLNATVAGSSTPGTSAAGGLSYIVPGQGGSQSGNGASSTYLTNTVYTLHGDGSNPYVIATDLGQNWTFEAEYRMDGEAVPSNTGLNTLFAYGEYENGVLVRTNRGDALYLKNTHCGHSIDLFNGSSTHGAFVAVKITYTSNGTEGTLRLYAEGKLFGEVTHAGELSPTNKTIVIGQAFGYQGFNGAVRNIRITAGTPTEGGTGSIKADGALLDAGTHTLTVTAAETDNYLAAIKSVTLVVDQANQTITWTTPDHITYGTLLSSTQLSATVAASSTAGATAPGRLSYNEAVGTLLNAGTHTLTVTADATKNYKAASKDVELVVGKADATIVVTAYSVTYDVTAHTATGTVSGVGPVNQSDLDLTGTTHTNAGTYTDTWVFTDTTGNYNNSTGTVVDTIAKANATIAVTPYSVTYNATAHTATGTVSGVGPVNQSDLDLTGTTHTNAGTYTDTWVFTDTTGNYNNSTGTVIDTISKANATIAVTPYSVTYDTLAHTATGTVSGAGPVNQSDLDLTGTTHTNAGTYTDTWVFTDTTGNYNNSTGTVVDTIAKANATIIVTPYSVTYDATAHTATGTVSGVGPVNQSDLELTGTTHTNAGTYTDTWVFTDTTGNYNNSTGTVDNSIAKAGLTITAVANTKTYDGSTSATATPTVGTMQGTDTVTGLTQAYDTANAGTGKNLSVASYTVNDGNGGFNYTVTLVDSIAGVVNQLTTATVRYTGDVFVTTTNTGSTNVPLAAQLSGGGDYTTATVKFYNAFTNILLATATPDANGIAATTFVCSSPGVGTSYLVRTVLSGANYSNIDQVFPTETWTASNMNAYAQVNVFTSTGMAGWLQGAGQYIDTTATGTLKPIEGVPISYGIAAPVAMAGSGSTTGMINIIIPTASGIYMVKAGTLSAITDSSTSRIVTSTSATLFKIGVNSSRDGNSISAPATSVTVVATIGKGATDEAQFSVYKGSTSYWNDNGLVTILNDLTDINGRKGKNRIIGS